MLFRSLSKGKYYNMESLIETLDKILETYEDLYQITSVSTEAFNVRLIRIINAAKQKTDRNVVVLIDEYDAPMHDSMKDKDLQDKIRDIMRNFFSPLKSEEDNLHFVFLTGISKFSQLSIFSGIEKVPPQMCPAANTLSFGYIIILSKTVAVNIS